MKSKVHPTYKTKYRVANWPAYNRALVRRGDVTVWVSSEATAAWTGRCCTNRHWPARGPPTGSSPALLHESSLARQRGSPAGHLAYPFG